MEEQITKIYFTEIENCNDCIFHDHTNHEEHYDGYSYDIHCKPANRMLNKDEQWHCLHHDHHKFPDWCPLPNKDNILKSNLITESLIWKR